MYEEGGYYAIKGLSYQYILSLIEVLKCTDVNKEFNFENLQDFNDDDCIYQMKYQETQHFTNSKIKEATIKIFLEYLKTKKDYILYVYFPDKNDGTLLFNSISELDKVLLNCKIKDKKYYFTDDDKEDFINHYKVIFSKDYIEKSNELIGLISNAMKISRGIAELYSLSLVAYVIQIIVKNSFENRICTKKELLSYLSDSAMEIAQDYLLKNNQKENYLKVMHNEYFFEKNINNHNRVFIINIPFTCIEDYYDCIYKIVKKFYVVNMKKNMILSKAPYIYLSDINSLDLADLKEKLINTINFTDGYRYKDSKFDIKYITKNFYSKDNISCKIISVENDLINVIDKLSNEGVKIYQFYSSEQVKIDKSLNPISIKIDEINDICKILK